MNVNDDLLGRLEAAPIVPLVVPLTMLRHHFKSHKNDYIDQQVFFYPYPEQLSLRNYI